VILDFAKWLVRVPFLRAFAKLPKGTITFVMTVRLSVFPHWTTGLTMDRFSWTFIYVCVNWKSFETI